MTRRLYSVSTILRNFKFCSFKCPVLFKIESLENGSDKDTRFGHFESVKFVLVRIRTICTLGYLC